MSLADWFRREFVLAEDAIRSVIHEAEKEITMIPQAFSDALDRVRALLSSHYSQSAADAQTISSLQAENADLRAKLDAANASNADLTQQVADMQAAVDALAPPPAQ